MFAKAPVKGFMDNEACFLSDIKIILSDIKIIERLTIVSALFINVLSKHTGYDSGILTLPLYSITTRVHP